MLLALLDNFSDIFTILKNIKEEEKQFNIEEKKVYLEENLAFDFNSNSKNTNNSNLVELKSNNSMFFQDFKRFIWLSKKWAKSFNDLITISNISYTREKLIKIVIKPSNTQTKMKYG